MRDDILEYEDIGFMEAVRAVEEAYEDNYPGQVRSYESSGSKVVRSKSAPDETKIEYGAGVVRLITSNSQSDTLARIKQNIDQMSGQAGRNVQETESTTTTEETSTSAVTEGNMMTEPGHDGAITFIPPESKRSAGYRTLDEPGFEEDHSRCKSCAHYIEGGGCHMVRGKIDVNAYCEEYYADIGLYGHSHDNFAELNLTKWGEEFDWDENDVEDFINRVESKLEEGL